MSKIMRKYTFSVSKIGGMTSKVLSFKTGFKLVLSIF